MRDLIKSVEQLVATGTEVEDRKPWDQRPDEPREAFEAFRAYLELPRQARIAGYRVAAGTNKLRRWSQVYDWFTRCDLHDEESDRFIVEARNNAIIKSNEEILREHRFVLDAARELVANEVSKFLIASRTTDASGLIKPNELIKMLEVTLKADRVSIGESTDIVQSTSNPAIDVSKLSLDEAKQLRELMLKASAKVEHTALTISAVAGSGEADTKG